MVVQAAKLRGNIAERMRVLLFMANFPYSIDRDLMIMENYYNTVEKVWRKCSFSLSIQA